VAVATYTDANGHLPPAYQLGPDGRPWHSWRVLLLPFIGHEDVFRAYRFDEPWNGPNNTRLAERRPKMYASTGNPHPDPTTTGYLAVVGAETMWPGATARTSAELKGASGDPILIVENNGLGVHWMEPRDLVFATMHFRLDHPEGVSSWYESPAVVTAGCSVQRLSKEMTPAELRAALTLTGDPRPGAGSGRTTIPDGRERPLKKQ
jgi:hypothetical protein